MLDGVLEDDYDVARQPFAHGAASTLHTCRHRRSGQTCVVKVYDKQRASARRLSLVRDEVRVALQLTPHPHVVRAYAAYEDASRICLVMEAMHGGSLLDRLRRVAATTGRGGGMPETRVQCLTRQLLAGVAHVHACGVMHRDIKPENVFFRDVDMSTSSNNSNNNNSSSDAIALGDFGFATDRIPSSEYLGSPQYSAPELALIALHTTTTTTHATPHRAVRPLYNEKCDVWSVGVVVFVMLTGMLPFDGDTPNEVFLAVLRNALPPDHTASARGGSGVVPISATAMSFVRALTVTDASKRPTAAQALRHTWLS